MELEHILGYKTHAPKYASSDRLLGCHLRKQGLMSENASGSGSSASIPIEIKERSSLLAVNVIIHSLGGVFGDDNILKGAREVRPHN